MLQESAEPVIPGLPFLLKKDEDLKIHSSEIDSSLNKLVEAVKGFVEMRSHVYMQKEEKMKKFQQSEMLRLKAEEEEYNNKCQEIAASISESAAELKELEKARLSCSKKLKAERQVIKNLTDELTNLKTDKEKAQGKFQKTLSLYLTAVKWYEDYLNIHIAIEGNQNTFKFYFNKFPSDNTPFIKCKALDNNSKFKILELHSDIQDDQENVKEVYKSSEMMAFIHSIYKRLKKGSPRKSALFDINV